MHFFQFQSGRWGAFDHKSIINGGAFDRQSCPGGGEFDQFKCRGGMFKLRFDRRISFKS